MAARAAKSCNVELLSGVSSSNPEKAAKSAEHKKLWLETHGLGDIKLNLAVGMQNKYLLQTRTFAD